ncbi:MAG: VOC family protein [Candidatus Brevundimonas colombiensis]|uniref:VOC family protein n=1 Tax=Candidatus Brevundimonas colombiensis TaxID=3121376 RepID=A0AAJ6BJQ1_9CAUL|nr:VOC family protein [Brevundimonas sp.]WEK38557.1 MAG: VOC family protein [Brevundimonas sp.]
MTDAAETRPPLVSHVSVGVTDLVRTGVFYDAVFASLGVGRVMEHPMGLAYGRALPEFWASIPHDRQAASAGNGAHVCFAAPDRDAVDRFHAQGLAAGGRDDGAPGFRPDYAPGYYAAFLRDPDGNKIEAMTWVRAAPGQA